MARNELMNRLRDQIVKIDMALITATRSELSMLEAVREDLVKQLDALRSQRRLAA